MTADSSDALIERIRAGDREALADFISLRTPQLLAFVERSLSSAMRKKVEAADIVQEASLSALNGFDDMDLADRDPFSWLCQLAERRIIDAHRRHFGAEKRSAHREVALHAPASDAPDSGGFIDLLVASMTSPSRAFSRNHKEFLLQQALEELPEDCRAAIRMRYVDGLPTKQIAARLGKSDGAVRVMLSRTLDRLQELLGKNSAFQ